ncbi:glycosyltransferase, partial [Escherichia coli]|nr:glycosyltransferase [Escherichia coli]
VCVVFFNENEGLAASLNKLIFGACNGYDFIARMDADDIVINGRFKKQLEYLNKHSDVSLVGGQAVVIDENDNVVRDYFNMNPV